MKDAKADFVSTYQAQYDSLIKAGLSPGQASQMATAGAATTAAAKNPGGTATTSQTTQTTQTTGDTGGSIVGDILGGISSSITPLTQGVTSLIKGLQGDKVAKENASAQLRMALAGDDHKAALQALNFQISQLKSNAPANVVQRQNQLVTVAALCGAGLAVFMAVKFFAS